MNIGAIGSYGGGFSTNMFGPISRMQSKQADPAEFASKILEQEDTDGDGVISAEESRLSTKRFGEIDTDSSGTLTTEEIVAGIESRQSQMMEGVMSMPRMFQPPSASEMASKLIEEEDTDGDGMISADESRVDSDIFSGIDTDGDGVLTAEELEASFEAMEPPAGGGMQGMAMQGMGGMMGMQGPPPMGPPPSASEMAASILEEEDTDGDGVLSATESKADSDIFTEIDADSDGVLTVDELEAHFEERESEMAANAAGATQQGVSNMDAGFQSLFEILSRNEASSAYGSQSWLYEMLQSASQGFTTTA